MTLLAWSLLASAGLVLLAVALLRWNNWIVWSVALLLTLVCEWRLVRGWRPRGG
jgi:hypothetical protein